MIYKDYKEIELTSGTKKAELFTKHRIKSLKNNMKKWKFFNVNSHSAYNKLTEDIFLNHTFDKDDFAMIQAFKEDIFPKKRMVTKEDYDIMYHIFINYKLTVTEAADYKYKCI
ncbi:hypothetical protein RhiirA4_463359 [Rhizophagus irregularis]|uniref:Uncharacterized protein n=1 Tax=Rhizophagus irregularis TaxID=588596 RepID=A0A2I1GMU5_9GLOM|nr:hypothetical protein RhiirA4_463359 [Rhizophagus irregularis]